MSHAENYYDFFCGNDCRLIKIGIKDDHIHAMKVEGNLARTIDLSGGTEKVNEILLTNCLMVNRIIWPEQLEFVQSLKIYAAPQLVSLDVSRLTHLRELIILNCSELTEIIGLNEHLRILNVHGTKISHVQVSACKQLEEFNIATTSSHFIAHLDNLQHLKFVSIKIENDIHHQQNQLICCLSSCKELNMLNIVSSAVPAFVDVSHCNRLHDLILQCGANSEIIGLPDCERLQFCYLQDNSHFSLDHASRSFLKKLEERNKRISFQVLENKLFDINFRISLFKESALKLSVLQDDTETVIQQHGKLRETNQGYSVLINLVSSPKQEAVFSSQNSYLHRQRIEVQESLDHLLADKQVSVIYQTKIVPHELQSRSLLRLKSFHSDNEPLLEWLKNPEKNQTQLLCIEAGIIRQLIDWQFILAFVLKQKQVIYDGQKYNLTEKMKLLITGDPRKLPYVVKKILVHYHPQSVYVPPSDYAVLKKLLQNKTHEQKSFYQDKEFNEIMAVYHATNRVEPLSHPKPYAMVHLVRDFLFTVSCLEEIYNFFNLIEEAPDSKTPREIIKHYLQAARVFEREVDFICEDREARQTPTAKTGMPFGTIHVDSLLDSIHELASSLQMLLARDEICHGVGKRTQQAPAALAVDPVLTTAKILESGLVELAEILKAEQPLQKIHQPAQAISAAPVLLLPTDTSSALLSLSVHLQSNEPYAAENLLTGIEKLKCEPNQVNMQAVLSSAKTLSASLCPVFIEVSETIPQVNAISIDSEKNEVALTLAKHDIQDFLGTARSLADTLKSLTDTVKQSYLARDEIEPANLRHAEWLHEESMKIIDDPRKDLMTQLLAAARDLTDGFKTMHFIGLHAAVNKLENKEALDQPLSIPSFHHHS